MTDQRSTYARVPSVDAYAPAHRALHWLMALLVIPMAPVGVYMVSRGAATNFDALTNTLYSSHKLTGFIVLWLAALRIVIKRRNGVPPPAATLTAFERIASTAVHHGLYALLIIVPLLGWAGVSAFGARSIFGWFSLPQILPQNEQLAKTILAIHGWAAMLMMALVAAHIAGAMMHLVVKKDGVFQRMWPR
jgi:cytochrome b561